MPLLRFTLAASSLLLVPKSHLPVLTRAVDLRTDRSFDGHGELTSNTDKVALFWDRQGREPLELPATLDGAALSSSMRVFVRATRASDAMDDVRLTLSLKSGTRPRGLDVSGTMTCLHARIDVFPCPDHAKVPGPVADGKKVEPGVPLHVEVRPSNLEALHSCSSRTGYSESPT